MIQIIFTFLRISPLKWKCILMEEFHKSFVGNFMEQRGFLLSLMLNCDWDLLWVSTNLFLGFFFKLIKQAMSMVMSLTSRKGYMMQSIYFPCTPKPLSFSCHPRNNHNYQFLMYPFRNFKIQEFLTWNS